jgi:hypothetical protein
MIEALNDFIADKDRSGLGPGFRIGHSFFVPGPSEMVPDEDWYRRIVTNQIIPLLEAYWFDDDTRVKHWSNKLLA